MRPVNLFIVIIVIIVAAFTLAARPADFCQWKPTHPQCAAPTPAPTSTPPDSEWVLAFSDDFTTDVPRGSWPTAVSDRWQAYTGLDSYTGSYHRPLLVVSQHDGYLDFYLHQDQPSGEWLAVGAQPILDGSGTAAGKYQTYGRYELLWLAPAIPGYYAVPLLWPQGEQYLRDGEIDWPEGNLTGNIHGFIHYTGASSGSDQKACSTGVPFSSGWHTTVTEWRPGSVRLYLDGVLVCEATERTPTVPMRWVLQFTVSPSGLPPAGTSGHVLIDHVRVWSYTP